MNEWQPLNDSMKLKKGKGEERDEDLRHYDSTNKLHRGLTSLMNFAFGFTEVGVLSSLCVTLGEGYGTGGPCVFLWGFVINSIMTGCIGMSLAELCAAYPSAGAVYHWAAQVAPSEYASAYSYLTGWSNWLGNAAGDAAFASGWASFVSAALVAGGGEELGTHVRVLISIVVLIAWTLLNFIRVDQVGMLNESVAVIHVMSMIVIIITILSMTENISSVDFVFGKFYNDTGFNSPIYVSLAGVTSALFAFAGYEASAHLAEETGNASVAASKGIICTIAATAIGGTALLLGMLFSCDKLSDIVNNDDASTSNPNTGNAAVNLFVLTCGHTVGSALAWLIAINLFFAGLSSVTVTGRITFALARDGAFPFSRALSSVHPEHKSPICALAFVGAIDGLILLLPLDKENGNIVYTAIIGLSVIGFQVSYAIPIVLKTFVPQPNFPVTSMDLGGFSFACGAVSSFWLLFTSALLFLPVQFPMTLANMNWLCLIVPLTVIVGLLNWHFHSRHHFKGPPAFEAMKRKIVSDKDLLSALKHEDKAPPLLLGGWGC